MLWNLLQEGRISEAREKADRAAAKADRYGDEIADLKRSVERLTLACQAMWELIRENSSISEEMLEARIQEIDLRDGVKDGRISKAPIDCPSCGAKTNSKRDRCIMCGAQLPKQHAFEA